jgi:small subunit ribosomal protein S17
MVKEILGVKAPQKTCTDKKCPFHGQINIKNELFKGKVVKKDINHSATIEWNRTQHVPKYERYETRRSRMRVHNPACIDASIGTEVLVAKTRPISKMKHHVIIQVIEKNENEPIKKVSKKKEKEEPKVEIDNKKSQQNVEENNQK